MLSPDDFRLASQWAGIMTLASAALAGLGFVLKWGIRFRLVGVAGFMLVLTGGLFALGLVPIVHTIVPGAVRFSLVFDNGANQVVIAVSPEITESQLTATLRQAATDHLFTYSRLGRDGQPVLLRARTLLHPEPGVSQPVYLGQAQRVFGAPDELAIALYPDQVALLPQPAMPAS
jgi:hypothetical protein